MSKIWAIRNALKEPTAPIVGATRFKANGFTCADVAGASKFLALRKITPQLNLWRDVAIFDPMDWSTTTGSGTWYPHNETSQSYITMSGTVRVENYIPSTTFNNYLYIKDFLPCGFRLIVDAELFLSSSHGNEIINSSTTGTSDNTRAFNLGISSLGKMSQNFKMNGNSSSPTFNDPNPPVVFDEMNRVVRAKFEVGVVRGENKTSHACYTAIDGAIASQGPFVDDSGFASELVSQGHMRLFCALAGQNYGYAESAKIYKIVIQENVSEVVYEQ